MDLWTPPLLFRRIPPQQNCPPSTVPRPDNVPWLETYQDKGGISLMAPHGPEPMLQRLPPILRMPGQIPILGYSEGSRGLSVYLRVSGICTAIAVSPSPSSRQWSPRYAIHAGRNLPDKEFRYLRTVIVTAAVNRGFGSELRSYELTPPLNLPAPSRRQTLYVVFTT